MHNATELLKSGIELMRQFASESEEKCGQLEAWLSGVSVFLTQPKPVRTFETVFVSGKMREAEIDDEEDTEDSTGHTIVGYETQTYVNKKLSEIMDTYLETYNAASKELVSLAYVEVGTTATIKLGNYAIGYLTVVG